MKLNLLQKAHDKITCEAEIDAHFKYYRYEILEKSTDNSRNGYSKRTVKSELGNMELRAYPKIIFYEQK